MSNPVGTGGGSRRDNSLATKIDAIPTALREYDHWVVAQLSPDDSDRDKRPLAPRRGHTDPDNCLSFEEAVTQAYRLANSRSVRTEEGERTILAFMLDETPFVGVDLDDVGTPTSLSSEAEQIISECDTWAEISQSGNSYHLLGVGSKEIDRCRADLREKGHIEIYDGGQYLCLTGDWLEGTPTEVKSIESSLRWLENEHLRSDKRDADASVNEEDGGRSEPTQQEPSSLVEIANRSANNRRNSGRRQQNSEERKRIDPDPSELTVDIIRETGSEWDPDFRRLWDGSNASKDNPSDADYAFVCKLAYWCRGDRKLMDECFRASKRYGMRPDYDLADVKWDSTAHYASGETYGEKMIKDALQDNRERHSGKYISPSGGSE